jgi:hypothetical protein
MSPVRLGGKGKRRKPGRLVSWRDQRFALALLIRRETVREKKPKENGAVKLGKAFLGLVPSGIMQNGSAIGAPMRASAGLKEALKDSGMEGQEDAFVAYLKEIAAGGKNFYHMAVSAFAASQLFADG